MFAKCKFSQCIFRISSHSCSYDPVPVTQSQFQSQFHWIYMCVFVHDAIENEIINCLFDTGLQLKQENKMISVCLYEQHHQASRVIFSMLNTSAKLIYIFNKWVFKFMWHNCCLLLCKPNQQKWINKLKYFKSRNCQKVAWVRNGFNGCISIAWYGKIVKYHHIQHNVYMNL